VKRNVNAAKYPKVQARRFEPGFNHNEMNGIHARVLTRKNIYLFPFLDSSFFWYMENFGSPLREPAMTHMPGKDQGGGPRTGVKTKVQAFHPTAEQKFQKCQWLWRAETKSEKKFKWDGGEKRSLDTLKLNLRVFK